MRLAIVVALVACQQSEPAPPPAPVPLPAPARDAAPAPDAAIDAAVPRTSDDDFKDLVRQYAKRRKLLLASWGTLHLDGSAKPYRYAGMVVNIDKDDRPDCDTPCTGGYIIEQAPGTYWYVATWWTAPVFHMPETDGPLPDEPAWDALDDTWIEHDQMHNHGKEKVSFGLRGGKFVILEDDDYNSRREDVGDRVYAKNGVCKGKCPAMAKWHPQGIYMELLGPVAKLEDLPAANPM